MPTLNETQDRTQKALDAFMRLSKAFTFFHTDEHTILQTAYDHIRTVLNVQNFCVVLHDKRTDQLSVAIAFRNGELLREESAAQAQLLSLLGIQKLNALRRTQQPILLDTRQKAKDNFPEDTIISSYLGVPMNVGGLATDKKQSGFIKTIGMMIVYSDHEHEYNEEDKRLLEMLADMTSNEFENVRQHQRFEVLAEVQKRLAIGKNEQNKLLEKEEQLLQSINEQIQQLKEIDTRNLSIVLREPKTGVLRLALRCHEGQTIQIKMAKIEREFFQQIPQHTIEKIVALPPGKRLLLKNRKAVAEEFAGIGKSETPASWLGLPMRVKGEQVLGVFIVYHETQEYAYDEMDAQILDMVSDQAAIALENLRLIDMENRQRQKTDQARRHAEISRKQAEALKEVAQIVSSSLDLKTVTEKIFEQLAHLVEYKSVSLQAIDNDERTIIGYRSFDRANYPSRLLRKLYEDRLISKIVERRKPIVLSDTKKSPLWDDFEETRQINSWIGVPLVVQDMVIGLLTVDHTQAGYYNQTTEELVVAFANQVAPALLNARLYHRLERRLMERVNDFNALRNIYASVGSSELQEVLQHILETGIRLTSSDYADTWLYDSDTHDIREEVDYHNQRTEPLYRQGSFRFNIFEKKSIVGHVIRTQTSYLCKDVTSDPYFLALKGDVKSELAVPIILREKRSERIVLGVLNFESLKLDAFTDEHYQLAQALAEQAAIAIHNARLTEMQQKQNQRQTALIELGKTLTSKIDVSEQDILNAIYQSTSSLMNTDTMFICLYEEVTRNVRFGLVYENGKRVDTSNMPKWRPRSINQGGRTEWIIREKKPLLLKTKDEFVKWYMEPGRHLHSGTTIEPSWLGVPMIVGDNVIGVIAISHNTKEYVYNETDRDFLLSIANQAAIALENARLFNELKLAQNEIVNRERVFITGSLAMDFTHKLNNIAGTIPPWISLIKRKLKSEGKEDPKVNEYLDKITRDVSFVLKETHELRKPVAEPQAVNMEELIASIVGQVEMVTSIDVNIEFQAEPNLPLVNCFEEQLATSIYVVIQNALKAIGYQGTISIALKNGFIDGKNIIQIDITDTGCGIPVDRFDSIFEYGKSYWTDKSGTGYGLWRTRNIIQSMGGNIKVQHSEIGKGTVFQITIPTIKPAIHS